MSFTPQPAVPRPDREIRRSKMYPWEDYADGQVYEAREGQQFASSVQSFTRSASAWATPRGLAVITEVIKEGDNEVGCFFQVVGPDDPRLSNDRRERLMTVLRDAGRDTPLWPTKRAPEGEGAGDGEGDDEARPEGESDGASPEGAGDHEHHGDGEQHQPDGEQPERSGLELPDGRLGF